MFEALLSFAINTRKDKRQGVHRVLMVLTSEARFHLNMKSPSMPLADE